MTGKINDKRAQLVVKDNNLIQKAKFNLTPTQQKLISYVISLIKPTDRELQKYEISIMDFCYLCGIDKNHFYSDFKDIIDDLDNKAFWIKTDTKVFKFRWFSEVEYMPRQGKVKVMLNSNIKAYLIDLSKNFTRYELYNILALKSKYSTRLYEIFKSYAFQRVKEIDLEELKELLCATNYSFRDFRRDILDKATAEINHFTDIDVSYETVSQGRKVVAIIFHIKPKDTFDTYNSYVNTIDEINRRNKQVKGQMSIYDLEN